MAGLVASLRTLGDVFRNQHLRRVQLAWAAYHLGRWVYFVSISLYAYDIGGAGAVGVVGFVSMAPAAVALPFASLVVDRYPRHIVLVALNALRAAVMVALTLAIFLEAPVAVPFGLAGIAGIVGAPIRTVTVTLAPVLARKPEELVAANVSTGALEGLGTMIGPAIGGLLAASWAPEAGVAAAAATYLVSTLGLLRLRIEGAVVRRRSTSVGAELLGGVTALRKDRRPQLVILLYAAQTLVRGVLNVLIVVAAAAMFSSVDAGVGWLNSAVGAGGLVGGLAASRLAHRRQLALPFGVALVLWGAPIAAVAGWPTAGFGILCLGVIGLGNALLDVSGFTLLQRTVDEHVMGRVFGIVEINAAATVAIGSIVGSSLEAWLGLRGALLVTGALLPTLAVTAFSTLRRIDATVDVPEHELAVLRSTSLFSPLPVTTLERLASHLEPHEAEEGEVVVREHEPGDLFYILDEGSADVSQAGHFLRTLGPGDVFGEVALLTSGTRSSSVVATEETRLFTLERDVFLNALSADGRVHSAASSLADARLRNIGAEPGSSSDAEN